MKNVFTAYLILVIPSILLSQSSGYTLIFSDDFDGSSLDLQKWNIETGFAANQEKQYYTDAFNTVRIESGSLIIQAKKEKAVPSRDYISGRINTKGKVFLKYGIIEARINVPSGAGTWPAFWMMPENSEYGTWPYSGEIDIMEHIGSDPRMISHAVHTANKNGSNGKNWYKRIYQDNIEDNFHVYKLVWGQDEMQFLVDDVVSTTLYRNFSEDYRGWPFNINYHVIINLAIGGTMGGTIDDNIFDNPVELMVDYIRIYQLNTAIESVQNDVVKIVPTCFNDNFAIQTSSPALIKIYDITGSVVLEKEVSGTEKVDTSLLANGVYLVKSSTQAFRIVKH
ncbi:hypothetical protein MASR2M117_12790 [Paludibacter sp.]